MLVVEEDQADGHGAQDEGEQGEGADGGGDGEAVDSDAGHALYCPHVDADPAAEGEEGGSIAELQAITDLTLK